MKTSLIALALASLIATAVSAQQPSVAAGGILNVASYTPSALPGGGIAQGSIFVVFGTNLGPAVLQQAGAFPLPSTLGGTSIKITSGGVTANAVMIYTSAGQVSAILPSAVPVGSATLTVTYNGQTSPSASFQVVANSFGTFTLNQAGNGPGVITDVNYSVFGLTTAANPSDPAIIWGTGLGAVSGAEANAPLPGDLANIPVEVLVGTEKAALTYRGRSGCCAGLDQIVFTVPNVSGCHVPVVLKIGNTVSNFTTIAVAPKGSRTCSDPGGPSATDLAKYVQQGGVSIGAVALIRVNANITIPIFGAVTTSTDAGAATFNRYTAAQLNSSQNPFNSTNYGACVVTWFRGGTATTADPVLPASLDAGASLAVKGPNGTKQMTKVASTGSYTGDFGTSTGGIPGLPSAAGFLDAGAYSVTGTGGKDVGAFSASIAVPPPLTWTNRDSISSVVRAQGQLITWSGGDSTGTVQITGSSTTGSSKDSYGAVFTCNAKASDGRFTIPASVLLSLPPSVVVSAGGTDVPTGALIVGAVTAPQTFTATGLDTGVVVSTVDSLKTLNFQ
jgi:uncharacterized protein (TIGR03437 family)